MPGQPNCFRFNHALVRQPAESVVDGLRAKDRGAPDLAVLKAQHRRYVKALRDAGLEVEALPPLEEFPDSVFVEDPALVFPEGAVLLRSRAPSRRGEAERIRPALEARFGRVLQLEEGFVDGGDVLLTPGKVMIGLSSRTDRAGGASLLESLRELGYRGELVRTPAGVLHLKSDCALLDEETVLVTGRLASSGAFDGFRTLVLPRGQEPAANALRVNDRVLVSAAWEAAVEMLDRAGYPVVALDTSEIGKLDAGLSCMSLRW